MKENTPETDLLWFEHPARDIFNLVQRVGAEHVSELVASKGASAIPTLACAATITFATLLERYEGQGIDNSHTALLRTLVDALLPVAEWQGALLLTYGEEHDAAKWIETHREGLKLQKLLGDEADGGGGSGV